MATFLKSKSWRDALEALEALPKSLRIARKASRKQACPPADRSLALSAGADLAKAAAGLSAALGAKRTPVPWRDALALAIEALAAEHGAIDARKSLLQTACHLAEPDEADECGLTPLPCCVAIAADVFAQGVGDVSTDVALPAALLLSIVGKSVGTRESVVARESALRAAASLVSRAPGKRHVKHVGACVVYTALRLVSMRSIHVRWAKRDREDGVCVVEMIKLLVGANGMPGVADLMLDANEENPGHPANPLFASLLHNLVFGGFAMYTVPRELRPGIARIVWLWIGETERCLRLAVVKDVAVLADAASMLLDLVRSEAVAGECKTIVDKRAAVNTTASLLLTLAKVARSTDDDLQTLAGAIDKGVQSLSRLDSGASDVDGYMTPLALHLSLRLTVLNPAGDSEAPVTTGVHSCCNRGCRNLEGIKELELKTMACGTGGCPQRYCSKECQIAVWRGGHNKRCLSRVVARG
jgi:hypothetical protein